jgi:RNA polymerase sigma-70 factor (ECF subfamily)
MDASDSRAFDQHLLAVARDRDAQAFAELYRVLAPRVARFLLKRRASEQMADEITQEVMLTVWRRAELFQPRKASASTWIFTIARNRWIDRLRRERRPEIDPEDPALVPSERAPESRVDARRKEHKLQEAITALPDEQAKLVRMAYIEGKSQSEIARATGLPIGTVKSRFRLALKKLRGAMTEQAS